MPRNVIRQRRAGWMALAALLAVPAGAHAQQTITGRVTEAGSGRVIDQAQVNVVGTNVGALTNAEGRYTLRGIQAGTHQVRVLRVGYSESKQSVSVAAGQAATLDFTLTSVAISLAPVVTTATGETRR